MFQKGFLSESFKSTAEASYQEYEIDALLAAICRQNPELEEAIPRIPSQGNLSRVIMFGRKEQCRVFKAPLNTRGLQLFENEVVILSRLKGKGLPVPELLAAYQGDVPFMEMSHMPGSPLPHDFEDMLSEQELQALAEDIIDFKIKMVLALNQPLMHYDLWADNIFVDHTYRLQSVIDFGICAEIDGQGNLYRCPMSEEFNDRYLKPAYEKRRRELDPVFRSHTPSRTGLTSDIFRAK